MQQSIDPTSDVAAQATSHIQRFSARMIRLLSVVPDDKILWAPSPTAKSSVRIVAHCAITNMAFTKLITGNMPESMPTPDEFFKGLDDDAEKITTRESAIALLKETTTELCKAIGTVNIDSTPNSPFGPIPIRFWINEGGNHMAVHTGQLEYLQTTWGDMDRYLG